MELSPKLCASAALVVAGVCGFTQATRAQDFPLTNNAATSVSGDFCGSLASITLQMAIQDAVKVKPSGPGMIAIFTPNFGLTLADAAEIGGFVGFNWQQTVTALPEPSPYRSADNPGVALVAPFLDPPPNGYATKPGPTGHPFYYDAAQLATVATQAGGTELVFYDTPTDSCLFGGTGVACGGQTAPAGSAVYFKTDLVGVLPNGRPSSSLFEFVWKSDFNMASGGVSRSSNLGGYDGGSGYGGVTLLSTRYPAERRD
jgi:hypothetical protein